MFAFEFWIYIVLVIILVEVITKKCTKWQSFRPSTVLHNVATGSTQMFSAIGECIAFVLGCHYYLWKYFQSFYAVLQKICAQGLLYLERGLLKFCRVCEIVWNKCAAALDFIIQHFLKLHLIFKEIFDAILDLVTPTLHLCVSPLAVIKGYVSHYTKESYGFCIYFGTLVCANIIFYLFWYDPIYYPDLLSFIFTFTCIAIFASAFAIPLFALPLDALFCYLDPKHVPWIW